MTEREVVCPVCGGIVQAPSEKELIRLAKLHTLDAHGYDVPAEHVLAYIEDAD
jgi:predicted small metal-binding protein